MVPPKFPGWSAFIFGGLHGLGDGGDGPPGVDPHAGFGIDPGGPTFNQPFPVMVSSTNDGPHFPLDVGVSQTIRTLYTSDSTSSCADAIPISTTDVIHQRNDNTPTADSDVPTECAISNDELTNAEQVGESTWGTLCQITLRQWLDKPDGTKYTTAPWGDHTTRDTDPTVHDNIPVTNITRSYEWTISRGRLSPDGVLRDVILVNNQYPGPMIEANFGDWIEVRVHNEIWEPEEGTALHWHGMIQRETPWMDGTPGVAQCPIAPGASYTYRFRAEVYGTTYWHAHYSAQYTAGVVGPIVIHGPSVREYDVDVGPVMLSDWNHIPYFSMVANIVGTDLSKLPPLSDNGLINGRGRFNCSNASYSKGTDWLGSYFDSNLTWTCVEGAQRAKFRFQSGKTHRLRLMNQGADGVQKFSIDNHKMTVIATDMVPTEPYETDVVTLGVGQRTDVLVTAGNDPKSAVWMRTQLPGGPICGGLGPYGSPRLPLGAPMPPETVYPDVTAAIYYEDADTTIDPVTTTTLEPTSCENDDLSLTRPDYAIPPAPDPYVLDLTMTLARNDTGNFEWRINDQTHRADLSAPLLYAVAAGQTAFPDHPEWNIHLLPDAPAARPVVLNLTNATPFTHPMHLHGHTFAVLALGPAGTVWDGGAAPGPADNPLRRDTQLVPAGGHAALQFVPDNPGVWAFHCHAAWHLASGLAVTLVSRPGEVGGIPDGARAGTCEAWERYSAGNVVDQIDSGS